MSNPERKRGGRVRGAVMMEFGPAGGITVQPHHAADLLTRAVKRVDDANHDAQPNVQFHAFETQYQQPPLAMRETFEVVSWAFGIIWFAEGSPIRWYHYGGSSRLRVEVAMFCARKLWTFCNRFAEKENIKQGFDEDARGDAIAFNNTQRHAWIGAVKNLMQPREIESWVLEAWRVEQNRERTRRSNPGGFVPRTMSYEQVSRWLDDVIESSRL